MRRRNFVTAATGAATLAAATTAASSAAAFAQTPAQPPAPRRPNLLLLLADDLGYAGLSFAGGKIPTPHLDALAARAKRLDPFYVFSNCTSSRAALFTGRHPVRQALLYGELRPWSAHGLPVTESTLADWFAQAGYATAYVGKWQLGSAHQRLHPRSRGFQHFYGHLTQHVHYFNHTALGGRDWQRNGQTLDEDGYTTDLFAAEALSWLQQQNSQPFFLTVAFGALGSPLLATDEAIYAFRHIKNEKQRLYAAATHQLDHAAGQILGALRQNGQLDHTVICFCSDNAGLLHMGANHAPFLGGKGSMFEGGLRVPALLALPPNLPSLSLPSSVRQPWLVTDVAPTLAALCNVPPPAKLALDGSNRLVATEAELAARELFFGYKMAESPAFRHALRQGPWKWIESDGQEYLFHLEQDPAEAKDLAAQQPQRLQALRARAAEWKALHPSGDIASSSRPHPGWVAPKDYAAAQRQD